MYDNDNKTGCSKEVWGCAGAIGAALVTSIIALIIASPTLIPFFFPTPTPIIANQPQPTSIAEPASTIQPTSVIIIAPTHPPVATEVVQVIPTSTATPDCWQTVWSFNPSGDGDITTLLSPPRTGYKTSFDTSIYSDSPGSLRIETSKIVKDPMQDANAWTWMDNTQTIIANNGLYRVIAMIKTQDVVATHISVVGRDKNGMDVSRNGTNQVSVVPIASRALYGTNDWNLYTSSEFNPKEWASSIEYIMIGINAGWSSDGRASITWFDNVQLQYCTR
jgi:hypothetical protein